VQAGRAEAHDGRLEDLLPTFLGGMTDGHGCVHAHMLVTTHKHVKPRRRRNERRPYIAAIERPA
jgi:hypothetical protein